MDNTASIGVDLGTSNSVIGCAHAGELDILSTTGGYRTVPSVVAYDGEEALVGRKAVNQAMQHPDWTIFSVKRYMGSDETVLLGPNETEFLPEEISALILKWLISEAEATLGTDITNAVITVPAYFSNRQREATKHAGEIAGIDVDRIINEPTAACLAYGLDTAQNMTLFVYDLGGGTFDASLITITDGIFEVIGTNGDSHLGGDDWDAAIVEWLEARIEDEYGFSIEDDPVAEERLFDAAQQAKHRLTSQAQTVISIPFFEHGEDTYDIEITLSREMMDQLTADLTQETIMLCEELLDDVEYGVADLDEVLLVGGATRMPQVQTQVRDYFRQDASKQTNPDEVVARGAAAQAAIINQTALPSGASPETPARSESSSETVSHSAEPADPILVDVTPQSLGTEIHPSPLRSEYDILIERNTPVPTKATKTYTTLEDGQQYIEFKVYQGDHHEMIKKNELLDKFEIGPFPRRPAGEPTIEATFEIDENGILMVSVVDTDYDVGGSIQISSVMGVSDDDIATMRSGLPTLRTKKENHSDGLF
jgi:molecular chaperone DnaK